MLNPLYTTFLPFACSFPLKPVIMMMMLLLAISSVAALSRISNSKISKVSRNRHVSLRPQEDSKLKLYPPSNSSAILLSTKFHWSVSLLGYENQSKRQLKLIHSRQDLKSVIIFLWDNPNAVICSQRGCGLVRTQNFVNRHSRER